MSAEPQGCLGEKGKRGAGTELGPQHQHPWELTRNDRAADGRQAGPRAPGSQALQVVLVLAQDLSPTVVCVDSTARECKSCWASYSNRRE